MERDLNTIVAALRVASLAYPEQRMGQISMNSVPEATDVFYLSDRELAGYIFEYAKKN